MAHCTIVELMHNVKTKFPNVGPFVLKYLDRCAAGALAPGLSVQGCSLWGRAPRLMCTATAEPRTRRGHSQQRGVRRASELLQGWSTKGQPCALNPCA